MVLWRFLLAAQLGMLVDAAWPISADQLSLPLVFAEVHPWLATPPVDGFYARWDDTGHSPSLSDVASVLWPLRGLYSSGNCSAVAEVGGDLKAAGVDVAVIDWIGGGVYPDEASRVATMLACLGIPAVVMVDLEPDWTREPFNASVERLRRVVTEFTGLQSYYRDPSTHLPIVFVWDPAAGADVASWNSLLRSFKEDGSTRCIFIAGLGFHTPLDWAAASLFDGVSVAADATEGSDEATFEWVIYNLRGKAQYNQFAVGWAIPGFDASANCDDESPRVVERSSGAVFSAKWAGLVNASWQGNQLAGAYVPYHNDGESNGIQAAAPQPPLRQAGYASCGGRLGQSYATYAPLDPSAYIGLNAQWAQRFKSSRWGAHQSAGRGRDGEERVGGEGGRARLRSSGL